jgi:hypothetical protein
MGTTPSNVKEPKSRISYQWGDDHLLIVVSNTVQPRIKLLFWAEFLFTIGMATIFLLQSLPLDQNLLHATAGLGATVLYLLAAYRFLSRMFFEERLLIDGTSFIIIQRTPFSLKTRTYLWKEIGPLHYVGKETKTDHPLKGRSFDYLGFETQEHLIQSLHHDGNMYFNYRGLPVRFARGVYSWDAEEIVRMMKLYIGGGLRLGPEWDMMKEEQEEWGDASI